MSTMKPDLYGGQKTPSKTTQTEARVGNANAGLKHDSSDFQVIGNVVPASLTFPRTASQVEVKHGTNAVTHERHMSERSSGAQFDVQEDSKILKELTNMSSEKAKLIQATSSFTQQTIHAGSRLSVTLASAATGLNSQDWVYTTFNTGTLNEYEEERPVESVNGAVVNLKYPFTNAPVTGMVLKRLHRREMNEAGSDFQERTFNFKTSADNGDVHIVHAQSGIVTTGTENPGSNSAVQSKQLQIAFNARPHENENGAIVPKFTEEYMYPANEAKNLS